MFDNVPQMREAWASPVYVSAADARRTGVKMGDGVLVTSQAGMIARPACVTERLMPGVLLVPHGSMPEVDASTGIDFGGHDNTLHKGAVMTQAVSGFNSTLAKLEKYDGKLPYDIDRPVISLHKGGA